MAAFGEREKLERWLGRMLRSRKICKAGRERKKGWEGLKNKIAGRKAPEEKSWWKEESRQKNNSGLRHTRKKICYRTAKPEGEKWEKCSKGMKWILEPERRRQEKWRETIGVEVYMHNALYPFPLFQSSFPTLSPSLSYSFDRKMEVLHCFSFLSFSF